MKEITDDILALERTLKVIKKQRCTLRTEWYNHPENVRKQLEMWSIPESVIESTSIQSLLVQYDPCADKETTNYDSAIVEEEKWSIRIEIDHVKHVYRAKKWTGDTEWDANFEIFDADGEYEWEDILEENGNTLAKAIASVGLIAFDRVTEDSILKSPVESLLLLGIHNQKADREETAKQS